MKAHRTIVEAVLTEVRLGPGGDTKKPANDDDAEEKVLPEPVAKEVKQARHAGTAIPIGILIRSILGGT